MAETEITAIFEKHGIRPTQQRIAVYSYLLAHRNHPSADTIYRALADIYPVFSRTTIYNSLNALVQAGLVRTVNICAEEQRFDADVDDHGHFICEKCREIFDFEVSSDVLERLCPTGYRFSKGDVFFSGVCPGCCG